MAEENKLPELTDKQKAFCKEYCYDWNGTQAAIRAGYSEQTAAVIASENLIKPNIQAYIQTIKNDLEFLCGISRKKVMEEHIKLAFSSIAHLHNTWIELKEFEQLTEDQKSCIAEITTQVKKYYPKDAPEYEIEFVKLKLYDKQKALDSISKMLGYDAAVKVEQRTIIESQLTPEQKQTVIDKL
jgi:phage terminase small subunit